MGRGMVGGELWEVSPPIFMVRKILKDTAEYMENTENSALGLIRNYLIFLKKQRMCNAYKER